MKSWQNNELVDQNRPLPMNLDEVRRTMMKKERLGFCLFDTEGRALNLDNCFDAVVGNGTRTIVLARADNIDINPRLPAATAQSQGNTQFGHGAKRLQLTGQPHGTVVSHYR